jgi:peptidoglycan/xylan/chitin deacetylase (PgdA/CDA1 family)
MEGFRLPGQGFMPTENETRMSYPWEPIRRYVARNSARLLFRKPVTIRAKQPIISFSFDDFPRTALLHGGAILRSRGFAGTYYVALGLLGQDSPSGQIAFREDLRDALLQGHELGCHTFSHYDAWYTNSKTFEDSIIQNRDALRELVPEAQFKSFSYPLSLPRPTIKRAAARYFECCRAGGQGINTGTADLNQLAAYFLEKAEGDVQTVKNVIDKNKRENGWVVFATHDVSPNPSPYGCTPEFFEEVVTYAMASGARILPVLQATRLIQGLNGYVD